jgi:hypothetical protein
VVHLDLDKVHGKRRVMEVLEVASAAEGIVQYNPIYSFELQDEACVWKRAGGLSSWDKLLKQHKAYVSPTGTEVVLDPEEMYRRYTESQNGR